MPVAANGPRSLPGKWTGASRSKSRSRAFSPRSVSNQINPQRPDKRAGQLVPPRNLRLVRFFFFAIMTSIPVVSSAMTAPSVRDAIASCMSFVAIFGRTDVLLDRRAQYFLANSTLPSPFFDEDAYSQDEEADVGSVREPDEECFETSDTLDQTAPQNDFVNQLEWDEDLDASGPNTTGPRDPPVAASVPVMGHIAKRLNERKRAVRPQPAIPSSLNPQWNIQRPQETTPLLIPKGPVSFDVPPRALSMSAKADQLDTTDSSEFAPHERRVSNVSVARSAKSNRSIKIVGQSTFGQTVRSFRIQ